MTGTLLAGEVAYYNHHMKAPLMWLILFLGGGPGSAAHLTLCCLQKLPYVIWWVM
jgi:hypothetical protein